MRQLAVAHKMHSFLHYSFTGSFSRIASGSDTSSESRDRNEGRPKPQKRKYKQKYKQAWEREEAFQNWLQPSKKGNIYAYCKACDMNLIDGKILLERHMKSAKHEGNARKLKSQPCLELPSLHKQKKLIRSFARTPTLQSRSLAAEQRHQLSQRL